MQAPWMNDYYRRIMAIRRSGGPEIREAAVAYRLTVRLELPTRL